ncbi:MULTISPECIES: PAS domain-containing sensor histidine kinase [unclassified Halomonas]|uniref:PAS domain-containing sensor histidine kinase n=1 Tax=unclassified Halomonas TaxID=2609666 RepID=UPI0009C229E2|nr:MULTISPECIES: ATP-binding protein [unclassified Halomonas]AQU81664.1 PAS domain-containing sensor histidine kinase [Halomonas sp. 'Soap Lake \
MAMATDDNAALRAKIAMLTARNAALEEEKRHYQWLAESTTDLISRHARDGTFLYASQAARDLLGYEPDELIGVSAYQLFHPADLNDLLNKSPQIYYNDGFYQQTYRFRAKAGHYVWFETTSRTRRDASTGELIDILCVSRDVGRRIHAEAIRERLAQVVESTTDYVLFLGPNQQVFSANEAARRCFSLPKDAMQVALDCLYQASSLSLLNDVVFPAVERYGSWSGELEMRGSSASVPVLSVVLAHRSRGAEPGHFALINRDISARKAAEVQAQRHQEQIAHANRLAATGELASNIAHEINQPLGAIANYTSGALFMCQQTPELPAKALQLPLSRIDEQVQRLAQRLRHMRSFVRKRSHRVRPIALDDVVVAACQLCDWQYKQAAIQLLQQLPPGLPRIYADPIALEQVIVNLLLNALTASREYRGADQVVLLAHKSNSRQVTLTVEDQGPGIPPEHQNIIFDAFFTTRDEGLGMGLAISRSLMESMGGALTLNPKGTLSGACFDIILRAEASRGSDPYAPAGT